MSYKPAAERLAVPFERALEPPGDRQHEARLQSKVNSLESEVASLRDELRTVRAKNIELWLQKERLIARVAELEG